MANFYWLDRIQPADRLCVGNKAFHLSLLINKGYPVVPGFVVSAQVLHEFLETIDWSAPLFADLPHTSLRLDIDNPQQLQAIAYQIRQSMHRAELPAPWETDLKTALETIQSPCVILRPSLAVLNDARPSTSVETNWVVNGKSSALFNSHVCAATTPQVMAGLKQLWAELFSARSLFYWQRSNIALNQIQLAVLVQPLWSGVAAGVVRTNPSLIDIEATLGLGMAIAQGEVTPDRHQIDIGSGQMWGQRLGKKTIAYQTVAPSTQVATELPAPDPCLTTTHVEDAQQAEFALSPDSLQDLLRLVHQLIADMGTSLEIEWLLATSVDKLPHLYLTQFIPMPLAVIERLPAAYAIPPTDLAGAEHLLVSGLGAASGEVIAQATVILHPEQPLPPLPPGRVLVARNLPPDCQSLIQQAAAIVTEQGGMTSHSAIIAREMRIPAVMGAAAATRQIQTNDLVRVDGTHGRVYRLSSPLPSTAEMPPSSPSLPNNLRSAVASLLDSDQQRPLIGTRLMVNLSQTQRLPDIVDLPIDGIGLLRSELLITPYLEGRHPQVWLHQGETTALTHRLTAALSHIAMALSPRPVFYRSLDLRSHEFRGLEGGDAATPEINPILGNHGTFSYSLNPALFELELAVLRQVQEKEVGNVHLLLPFVRTVEEFQYCQHKIQQAGLTQNPHFETWIMAEVPAILFLIPELVRAGVQGIAIGSNDLTQLLLAVDRDNATMSTLFDERHPAVKAAIAHLIKAAAAANIPCSICGQAPVRYPELIVDLIHWGVTSISVEPEALESTYWAIARAERQLLLAATRSLFS